MATNPLLSKISQVARVILGKLLIWIQFDLIRFLYFLAIVNVVGIEEN